MTTDHNAQESRVKDIQRKLVQWPQGFRDTYDTLKAVEHDQSALEKKDGKVHPRYRSSKRKEIECKRERWTRSHGIAQHGRFGKSLWAISLTSKSNNHLDDNCLHSAWQESSWVVHFRLAYCGRLLAGALQASFACTTGAGGASFTPSLNLRNVVAQDSPAFVIVSKTEFEDPDRRFESQIHDLRKLFEERRASPYDIDANGNTLVHVSKPARLLRK